MGKVNQLWQDEYNELAQGYKESHPNATDEECCAYADRKMGGRDEQ
jgi:hypothetical protein